MSDERYQQRQQRVKEKVDARVAQAQDERGIIILFTGNGKGKTTAAFGTATRAVGHGKKVGVVQFIKGTWPNGERNLLEPHGVEFQVMATGFTWDTQNRESDTAACREVWQHAKRMLADSSLDMVLLDELTYMVAYDYLPLEEVVQALNERPHQQTVIITGYRQSPRCYGASGKKRGLRYYGSCWQSAAGRESPDLVHVPEKILHRRH